MEKKLKILVDTDVLIKAHRGDNIKIKNLALIKDQYCISILTAIELVAGAKSIKQLASLNKALKVYTILPINESISGSDSAIVTIDEISIMVNGKLANLPPIWLL